MSQPQVVVFGSGFHALAAIAKMQQLCSPLNERIKLLWISHPCGMVNIGRDATGDVSIEARKLKYRTYRHIFGSVDSILAKSLLCEGEEIPFDALLLAPDPLLDSLPVRVSDCSPIVLNVNDPLQEAEALWRIETAKPIEYSEIVVTEAAAQERPADYDSDDEIDEGPDEDDVVVKERPTTFQALLPIEERGVAWRYVDACVTTSSRVHWEIVEALRFGGVGDITTANSLGDDGLQRLTTILKDCHIDDSSRFLLPLDVRSVTLADSGITEVSLSSLTESFFVRDGRPVVSQLTSLDLSGNALGPGIPSLLTSIPNGGAPLSALHLRGVGLTATEQPLISKVLATVPTVVDIDLSGNDLGSEGAAGVLHSCRHNARFVTLRDVGMDDAAAPRLRALLLSSSAEPSKIERLDLSVNDIGDACALAIGEALMSASVQSLRSLSLEGCREVSDTAAGFLFSCIAGIAADGVLEEVLLRGASPLGAHQGIPIAEAVRAVPSLTRIAVTLRPAHQLVLKTILEGIRSSSITEFEIDLPEPEEPLKEELILSEETNEQFQAALRSNRERTQAAFDASDSGDSSESLRRHTQMTLAAHFGRVAANGEETSVKYLFTDDVTGMLPPEYTTTYAEYIEDRHGVTLVDIPSVPIDAKLVFAPPLVNETAAITGTSTSVPVFDDFRVKRKDSAALKDNYSPVYAVGAGCTSSKLPMVSPLDMQAGCLPNHAALVGAAVAQITSTVLASGATLNPSSLEGIAADPRRLAEHAVWGPMDDVEAYLRHHRIGDVVEYLLAALDSRRPPPHSDRAEMPEEELRRESMRRRSSAREAAAAAMKERERAAAAAERARQKAEKKERSKSVKGGKDKDAAKEAAAAEDKEEKPAALPPPPPKKSVPFPEDVLTVLLRAIREARDQPTLVASAIL